LTAHRKGARRRLSSLVVLDETGFCLQPLRRRTWGLRDQTLVQRCWNRHDRLSVIGAITLSPHCQRLDLHFNVWHDNIWQYEMMGQQVDRFLEHLHEFLSEDALRKFGIFSRHFWLYKAMSKDSCGPA
jgi:hypothetical protein